MYVIDTYALMEWFIQNNQNYKRHFEQIEINGGFITELTILEFYHTVFHRLGEEKSDEMLSIVLANAKVIDLNLELIKEAAILRSTMLRKKKKLSYADSVNYAVARNLKIKLLTGDEAFRDMENVEFVK